MSKTKQLVPEQVDEFDELYYETDGAHQLLTIMGSLVKLNEHDEANRRNRFLGAKLKKEMTHLVAQQASSLEVIQKPILLRFHWYFASRHDFDNIAFAKKYILDGMIEAGKLPNDNQKWVHGFRGDYFHRVEKGQEKVVVVIKDSPYDVI